MVCQRLAGWTFLVALVWPLSMVDAAEAPSSPSPPANESAAADDQTDSPVVAPDLATQLQQQLLRLRAARQAAMSDDPAPQPDQPATSPADHRQLNQLRRELVERQALWQDRQDRLNTDLTRLEELFQGAPWCQPPAPDVSPQSAAPASVPASDPAPSAADSTTAPVSAPPSLVRPGPVTEPPVAAAEPSPQAIPPALVEAIAVTDQPVDRLGLANNLYGTGEYNLALADLRAH